MRRAGQKWSENVGGAKSDLRPCRQEWFMVSVVILTVQWDFQDKRGAFASAFTVGR